MSTDARRWAAEQVIRQHTEAPPLVEWRDPVTSARHLVAYRATGRCPRCRSGGCDLHRWASAILDGSGSEPGA